MTLYAQTETADARPARVSSIGRTKTEIGRVPLSEKKENVEGKRSKQKLPRTGDNLPDLRPSYDFEDPSALKSNKYTSNPPKKFRPPNPQVCFSLILLPVDTDKYLGSNMDVRTHIRQWLAYRIQSITIIWLLWREMLHAA